MTEIIKDTQYYLELFVTDSNGEPVTGLTVSYVLYKCSDNSTVSSGSLTDVGNGVYQSNYTFSTLGQYRVIYNTPSGYTDEIETINVVEQAAQSSALERILGLCQENYRIFNQQYNRDMNLIGATIRIYANASDVDTNTNPIAEYEMTAQFQARTPKMQDYRVKRIF